MTEAWDLSPSGWIQSSCSHLLPGWPWAVEKVGGCPGRGRKQSEVTVDGDGVVEATGSGPDADSALVVLTWG